jgi:ATP-dependent protease Clp ATPase subunit
MENVDLRLAEDALGAISRKAITRKAGAWPPLDHGVSTA